MTIFQKLKIKNQIMYDERGEGVGASDPMEGMKKQKGEVTKQIEQLKEAEGQYKEALRGVKNRIAELQGSQGPAMKKELIKTQGELAKYKTEVASLKKSQYDIKVERNLNTDSGAQKAYSQQLEQISNALAQYEDAVKQLTQKERNIKDQLDQIQQAISSLNQQLQQYQQALSNVQSQLVMANAQKKGLEVQLKHMAGAVLKQREIKSSTGKKVDAVHAEQGTVAG